MERLFTLDAQLLFDAVVLALSMLVLCTLLSYLLFNPVRDMLENRKQKIADEQKEAKHEKEEASACKAEYKSKLKEVEKEAEEILSTARKRAQKNEMKVIAEAKEEAARNMARASAEIELEKRRALDEVKQDIITIASMMAGKAAAVSINSEIQELLFYETLEEIGEGTWQK